MQFSFEFTASAESIFEHITDPDFVMSRCEALGSIEASCESDGQDLPTIITRRVEQAELPSMMKKIIGEQQTTETKEQWSETDVSYESESQTSIAGTPIKIGVNQSLYNTDDGSEISVELSVVAKIPLVGKKVEPMVATKIRQEMLREFEYLENAVS